MTKVWHKQKYERRGKWSSPNKLPGHCYPETGSSFCSSEKERLGKENVLDNINLPPAKPAQV